MGVAKEYKGCKIWNEVKVITENGFFKSVPAKGYYVSGCTGIGVNTNFRTVKSAMDKIDFCKKVSTH